MSSCPPDNQLNALFRRRIGFSSDEKMAFEHLETVLGLTALAFPFENLRILSQSANPVSRENLIDKMLIHQEGGLCYELNTILYLFLLDNGFNAVLARGVVYNQDAGQYSTLGQTHVMILLTHKQRTYLLDTGFGGNLPLKPVPLTGETIASDNGQFRITDATGEKAHLEMKLKHKHTDWTIGYAFDKCKTFTDITECNIIRDIVTEHEDSRFNKHPLITKLTQGGNITLTDTSFTQWKDGIVTKENIDGVRYEELLKRHFGL